MDNLKSINDRFGHPAGDAAIREFADRLKQASRSSDTIARLGGDEFAIILSRVTDRDGANHHAVRLQELMAASFKLKGEDLCLHASIGCALYPDDGEDLDTLLECADRLMYEAKRERRAAAGKSA